MITSDKATTHRVTIFIAGDINVARELCREYCITTPLCVTLKPCDYIYTHGMEAGIEIGLLNYPKFPATSHAINGKAEALALMLMQHLHQRSVLVVDPEYTTWHHLVEEK